jgi:predicted Rossmann fold flavoprotein
MSEVKRLGISLRLKCRAEAFSQVGSSWHIRTNTGELVSEVLIITTGGSPAIWKSLAAIGFTIVPPVPSLFTFHCKHDLIKDLAGISFPNAMVREINSKMEQTGPILITHEGLSGPAVLKLSAWAARELFELNYRFELSVNWLGIHSEGLKKAVLEAQNDHPKKHVINQVLLHIPKRFWVNLCALSDIPTNRNYSEIGKKQIALLTANLLNCRIEITGKSTNKDEFVTAGGVDLTEIDFTSFKAKRHKNLYVAGEVLNIDGVTGGFNFQSAWTGGYIIGNSITNASIEG